MVLAAKVLIAVPLWEELPLVQVRGCIHLPTQLVGDAGGQVHGTWWGFIVPCGLEPGCGAGRARVALQPSWGNVVLRGRPDVSSALAAEGWWVKRCRGRRRQMLVG